VSTVLLVQAKVRVVVPAQTALVFKPRPRNTAHLPLAPLHLVLNPLRANMAHLDLMLARQSTHQVVVVATMDSVPHQLAMDVMETVALLVVDQTTMERVATEMLRLLRRNTVHPDSMQAHLTATAMATETDAADNNLHRLNTVLQMLHKMEMDALVAQDLVANNPHPLSTVPQMLAVLLLVNLEMDVLAALDLAVNNLRPHNTVLQTVVAQDDQMAMELLDEDRTEMAAEMEMVLKPLHLNTALLVSRLARQTAMETAVVVALELEVNHKHPQHNMVHQTLVIRMAKMETDAAVAPDLVVSKLLQLNTVPLVLRMEMLAVEAMVLAEDKMAVLTDAEMVLKLLHLNMVHPASQLVHQMVTVLLVVLLVKLVLVEVAALHPLNTAPHLTETVLPVEDQLEMVPPVKMETALRLHRLNTVHPVSTLAHQTATVVVVAPPVLDNKLLSRLMAPQLVVHWVVEVLAVLDLTPLHPQTAMAPQVLLVDKMDKVDRVDSVVQDQVEAVLPTMNKAM
jgi:hypothetical protein